MEVWNKSSLVNIINMNTVADGNAFRFGLPIAWVYVILDSVTQVINLYLCRETSKSELHFIVM